MTKFILLCFFLVACMPALAQFQRTPEQDSLIAELNRKTQADHKHMMAQLGIATLRQGANGSDPNAPNAANYDESKANPYPEWPPLLVRKNGETVASSQEWWEVRRAEIVEDFDREVYGRFPAEIPEVSWELVETKEEMKGKHPVLVKTFVGKVDNSSYPAISVDIEMTLVVPASVEQAVPVMIQFSFVWPPWFPPRPDADQVPAWQTQLLDEGWGFAELVAASIQADNGAGLTEGIIGLVNKGQRRKPDDWGSLKAWAWGAGRALDYLESDPHVDAGRVGITGHSRFGKAAVVTLAYDERFSVGYISSSGAGGVKPHRRNSGEIVENVAAANEYHWMAGNYINYAGPLQWDDLPVDSHQLLALCAPRPVFIGAGLAGDEWVDPKGMFMATVAAAPVYGLLGKKGLGTDDYPEVGVALISGDLAFRQHDEGHIPGPNWPAFIEFAKKYWE